MRTITVALGEKTYNIEIAARAAGSDRGKGQSAFSGGKSGHHQRQQCRPFIWREAGTQPGCQRV